MLWLTHFLLQKYLELPDELFVFLALSHFPFKINVFWVQLFFVLVLSLIFKSLFVLFEFLGLPLE